MPSSRAVEPGQPFVEEQELGIERQRPGQLQPLLVDIGELAGRYVGARRQPDAVEQLERPLARRLAPERVGPEGEAGETLSRQRQRPEHAHELEGPRDAEARDVMRRACG